MIEVLKPENIKKVIIYKVIQKQLSNNRNNNQNKID